MPRAMVICDKGKSYYDYNDNTGWSLHFDRLIRIKIFTNEGYDWASHKIELYKTSSSKEKLAKLKAYTYNLENGKIVKEKLKSSDVYYEERSKNREYARFSMPQVREGSVIEIEYSVNSEFFFNLSSWYFQYDIPVAWSEYVTQIPDFFNYKMDMRGYIPLLVDESGYERKSVMITSKENTGNKMVYSSNFSTDVYEYNVNTNHWVAVDVAAFIEEEPLTSMENYVSKMDFELASYEPKYGQHENFTKTWEDINDLLLKDSDFGLQLNGGGFLKDLVEEISAVATNPEEKMVVAYNAIKMQMKWTERNSVFTSQNLRSAFNDRKGNSADINLLLVLLLNRLDIDADPVVLSTRAHGIVSPIQPTLSKFNYTIAAAFIGDKIYLMDATSIMVPFGLLPKRVLNDRGRIISKERPGWVNLMIDKPFKEFTMTTFTFGDDLVMSGSMQKGCNDYAGLYARNEVNEYTSEDEYIQSIEDEHPGLEVLEFELINRQNYDEPYKEKFEVTLTDQIVDAGEILYFSPMFTSAIDENPFKLEERKYPIEYPYHLEFGYMASITIPEGYAIDEVPQNAMVHLPEKAGSFVYSVTQLGNVLQVMSKIQINKNFFPHSDYEWLKTFYDHIITKHSEQVVLRKL